MLRRCQSDEPTVREIQQRHWAQCHQLPGYDAAPQTVPLIANKREVVPLVVEPEGKPVMTAGAGAASGAGAGASASEVST